MTTLAQAVSVLSRNKWTVGANGKITHEALAVLESLLDGDVTRMNPGFTGESLIRFKAYFVLHELETSPGNGQIIEKTVKDTRWKIAQSKTGSQWMDKIDLMIAEYNKKSVANTAFSRVTRSDAVMKSLQFDNTGSPQYGDPSQGEW
jgi:hypothetical protein